MSEDAQVAACLTVAVAALMGGALLSAGLWGRDGFSLALVLVGSSMLGGAALLASYALGYARVRLTWGDRS